MYRLHCSPDLPDPPGAACLERLAAVARRTLSCHCAGGSVDVILTGDVEVRRLNRTFRGRDQATDVLSFSFVDGDHQANPKDEFLAEQDMPAGEVYISVERAAAQGEELGVPRDEELARLLVHGLLHLAGYDHQTEADLQTMEGLTDELLGTTAPPIRPGGRIY
jgi:probable rRNA maturation factor